MKIRITPGAIFMLIALVADRSPMLPTTILAALFHDLGHLLAAKALRIPLRLLELDLFGARLYPLKEIPDYRAEGLLAAAGPLASLLLWGLAVPVTGAFGSCLRLSTLSLALFNLMPISGFDGGRVLFSLLATATNEHTAQRVLEISSYLSLLLLFSVSACMLLRYGQQLSLAILSASLFAEVFLPKNGRT